MSNNRDDFDDDRMSPEFLKKLEATILAAGKFVVPSDNLRPHTLEAARDCFPDSMGGYRFAQFSLAVFVFVSVSLPVASRLASLSESLSPPTSSEMHEIAVEKSVGLDWGLAEAYSELRQTQAARFRPSMTESNQE